MGWCTLFTFLILCRKLCSKLYFKAEAQQIDRILEVFANRYWTCNPDTILRTAGKLFFSLPKIIHVHISGDLMYVAFRCCLCSGILGIATQH